MKKSILLITLIFVAVVFVNAQDDIPTAPSTPVVRDDNIKLRSVELERVKRDSVKKESDVLVADATVNNEIDKKYPEIKEDFEGMQLSQAAIIKAYTTGDKIDYALIEASAIQINKNAKRLDSNLFETKLKPESDDKEKVETKTIRDLIVELDNTIGDVVTSKMFVNLRVIDPTVANKTQIDVAKILNLSVELSEAAKKMK